MRNSRRGGRKCASVTEASRSTLYRKAKEIIIFAEHNLEVLELAVRLCKNENDCAEINCNSDDLENGISAHSPDSGLAFYLENDYSKRSWRSLCMDTRSRGIKIYPTYKVISQAMAKCRPENCTASELEVTVPLQSLLNKTSERLCFAIAEDWDQEDLLQLKLIATVGFDSSSGHTNAQQKCQDSDNNCSNPTQSLFVSSVLICMLHSDSNKFSWINPTPQSERFCRPKHIALEKETEDLIAKEYATVHSEIQALKSHKFLMPNGKKVNISFEVYETMYDGKCLNAIVGNKATTRCPICTRTSHTFNNPDEYFNPILSNLKYGLGLLHCQIKSFEHLLHISYRKSLRLWDVAKDKKSTLC